MNPLAKKARDAYVLAKGCPENQVLPWDAPPGKPEQGIHYKHKVAWTIVTSGLLYWLDGCLHTSPAEMPSEDEALRRAWDDYASTLGASAFATPWDRCGEQHKEAWRSVLTTIRENCATGTTDAGTKEDARS